MTDEDEKVDHDVCELDVERMTMSRQEAAKALGVHVNTIKAWNRTGYLTSEKLGSKVLISRARVEALVRRVTGTEEE